MTLLCLACELGDTSTIDAAVKATARNFQSHYDHKDLLAIGRVSPGMVSRLLDDDEFFVKHEDQVWDLLDAYTGDPGYPNEGSLSKDPNPNPNPNWLPE